MSPSTPTPRHVVRSVVALWCVAALAACSDDGGRAANRTDDPRPTTTQAPADPQPVDRRETVLDLSGDTSTDPPIDGLLSIALTPDGRRLLTVQNAVDGSILVRSFPYSTTARLVPDDGFVVMRVPHPFIHSGGAIVVQASGDALVSVGAFTRPGEPFGPQNPDGSVIRIPARYLTDAAAGPFVPTTADLVARGLRNPWRISLDRSTGDLWIGDVGDEIEEIDHVPAPRASSSPPNYGYPYREGERVWFDEEPPAGVRLVAPRWWGDHVSVSRSAVIGGYVYHGSELPSLRGWYLFGDVSDRSVMALDTSNPGAPPKVVGQVAEMVTSFGETTDGELLVLGASGTIYRMVAAPPGAPDEVTTEWLGSIWVNPPTGNASEATSVVPEPGTSSLLASERGGLVTRVTPDAPTSPVCGQELTEVPSLDVRTADEVRDAVAAYRAFPDAVGAALPERLQPFVATLRRAADGVWSLGSTKGWDAPALRSEVKAMMVERGRYADTQRAVASINTYIRSICPPAAPAPPAPADSGG